MPQVKTAMTPLAHAVSGSIGSALALWLLYPLERARLELQVSAKVKRSASQQAREEREDERDDNSNDQPEYSNSSSKPWVACRTSPTSSTSDDDFVGEIPNIREELLTNEETGVLCCLRRLYKRGELYRGEGPVIVTLAASNFVFFYAHQAAKRVLLPSTDGQHSASPRRGQVARSLMASTLAGIVNVILTNPLWVANMRIVNGEGTSSSLWRNMHTIVKKEGAASLWNGTYASLLLVSNPVIQFFAYEQMKSARLEWKKNSGADRPARRLSPSEAFALGAAAKALATVLTYPLQLTQVLLRMEQQPDNEESCTNTGELKCRGIWKCLMRLYDQGGRASLFRGMKAKLLQTVLTAAFSFLSYEQILTAVQASLTSVRVARRRRPFYKNPCCK